MIQYITNLTKRWIWRF